MTTQIKIEVTQAHMPVIVETQGQRTILRKLGDSHTCYIHSAADVKVSEMSTAEAHNEGIFGMGEGQRQP